uniref:Uncharacterized protein n=1 Tax=Nelumbo nucifera TaxID=4432 RepID=A0A822YA44_NELNU|nr:TPA_asm: hypothetical protein HUJ06_029889 [Nelumbo nucifera]
MPAVESLRPITYRKIYTNSNYYFKEVAILNFFSGRSRVFPLKPAGFGGKPFSLYSISLHRQSRVRRNFDGCDVWGSFLKSQRWMEKGIRANSSCEQDRDSKTSSNENNEENSKETNGGNKPSPTSPRREKRGKGGFWKGGSWQWHPIIQAQEIGVLLLQLGIVIFVMKLLRPGIPLPGSEPRGPTTFLSVPYSEFLSKINNNQVQKWRLMVFISCSG